jgi:hypothetical protein
MYIFVRSTYTKVVTHDDGIEKKEDWKVTDKIEVMMMTVQTGIGKVSSFWREKSQNAGSKLSLLLRDQTDFLQQCQKVHSLFFILNFLSTGQHCAYNKMCNMNV